MKKYLVAILLLSSISYLHSQVLNWNTATRTGTAPNYTYTGTGISAVISTNAVTLGDGTPRVDGGSSNSACYLNPGLALYAGFFNSYTSGTNSNITTTFSFAGGYGCSEVTFTIKDINSEESSKTFCDVIELSATFDNAGTALPAANIVTTLASNVTRVVSGNTVKLVGHNSVSETTVSATSGSGCALTTVKFTPPSGFPLKTFTVKYRPAYGTSSSNAYYTSGSRPAAQFVSFGNLSFTATSSCVTLLPIELTSFNAARLGNNVALNWETASEVNNDYFVTEKSTDGINFETMEIIKGKGSAYQKTTYQTYDEHSNKGITYYRLKQVDKNGEYAYSQIAVVDGIETVSLSEPHPNPSNGVFSISFQLKQQTSFVTDIYDVSGKLIKSYNDTFDAGNTQKLVDLREFENGIYFLNVRSANGTCNFNYRLIRQSSVNMN